MSTSPARPPRRRVAGAAALLTALALVAHARALTCGWVWDDDMYVTENALLVAPDGLARIWLEPTASPQYYPLVFTTFRVERALWGLDPRAFHGGNLLLHAVSAVLLWRLLARLRVPGAWLGAALWACHPVQVESVAWVSERKNVLSMALAMGAALLAAPLVLERPGLDGRRAAARALAATALFVLALLSKSVVASLPAALLVIAWWRRRLDRRAVAVTAPMFVVGLAAGLHTAWLERVHVGADLGLSAAERVLVAGRALPTYVGHLAWPHPLMFVYPRWPVVAGDAGAWLWPAATLGVLVALGCARGRLGRGPLAACLVFAGVLSPALGFLDVYPLRFSWVADHFQYHASAALLALAAAAITVAAGRMAGPERAASARRLVGGLLVLACMQLCWTRTPAFRDEPTLWRTTLAQNPGATIARMNLASLLLRDAERLALTGHRGDAAACRAEARRTLSPLFDAPLDAVDSRLLAQNMARLAAQEAHLAEEVRWRRRGVEAAPDDDEAVVALAGVLERAGDHEEAVATLRVRLAASPGRLLPSAFLARLLATAPEPVRDLGAAEDLARGSVGDHPASALARSTLAAVLSAHGRHAEALVEARRALELLEAQGAPPAVRRAAAAEVARLVDASTRR